MYVYFEHIHTGLGSSAAVADVPLVYFFYAGDVELLDKSEEKWVCSDGDRRPGFQNDWSSFAGKSMVTVRTNAKKQVCMPCTNSHYQGNIRFLQYKSIKRHFENGKLDPNIIAVLLVPWESFILCISEDSPFCPSRRVRYPVLTLLSAVCRIDAFLFGTRWVYRTGRMV